MKQAVFDETGTYRYRLSRSWLGGTGGVVFIMLNPSTADDKVDDPTIRRCIRFGQRWGFARLEVVNLFAYRAKDPGALIHVQDPIGPENDAHILEAATENGTIIAAWGGNGSWRGRDTAVIGLLSDRPMLCLGRTKPPSRFTGHGHPRHPLYVPYSQVLEKYP